MRVELGSEEQLPDLVRALTAAKCLVHRLDETTCEVTPLEGADPREALVELGFFVAAWASVRATTARAVTS